MDLNFYFTIFSLKLIENAFYSLAMCFLTSGEKKKVALMAFFHVVSWGLGTGIVVLNLFDDLFILFPFLLGGQIGIYLGMIVQNIFSRRNMVVIGITKDIFLDKTMMKLKTSNFGATVIESEDETKVIIIATKRNNVSKIRKILKEFNESSKIIINPANTPIGGYIY